MTDDNNTVELATELTVAWLSNPNTRTNADDVPAFLKSMHEAVARLSAPAAPKSEEEPEPEREYMPAVTVRKSLANPDYIISMIDGKPYKALRRHLSTNGMTPDDYRQRYGLKPDYPMVAPTYSESRRAMAHRIGLGRKARASVAQAEEAVGDAGTKVAKTARMSGQAAKKAAQEHLGG